MSLAVLYLNSTLDRYGCIQDGWYVKGGISQFELIKINGTKANVTECRIAAFAPDAHRTIPV